MHVLWLVEAKFLSPESHRGRLPSHPRYNMELTAEPGNVSSANIFQDGRFQCAASMLRCIWRFWLLHGGGRTAL